MQMRRLNRFRWNLSARVLRALINRFYNLPQEILNPGKKQEKGP